MYLPSSGGDSGCGLTVNIFGLSVERVKYNPLGRDFYLHETTIAGKGAARGHFISGQDIDAASSVQSLRVRVKPSTRVQAGYSRHDAVCDFSSREQLASIVEHPDLITGADAPRLGVSGVEPDRVIGQRL